MIIKWSIYAAIEYLKEKISAEGVISQPKASKKPRDHFQDAYLMQQVELFNIITEDMHKKTT